MTSLQDPGGTEGKPCVFFDRDGIINEPPTLDRYVRNWGEFKPIPGFFDVLRLVRERGYEAVVVTNQKGVSTGRMTQGDVDEIHDNLLQMMREKGLGVLDVMVCTAAEDDHPHRKPNPGLLLEAAERNGLDLRRSWMIGDNEKDVVAGRRAGCRTVLVGDLSRETTADAHVADVAALLDFLGDNLQPTGPV